MTCGLCQKPTSTDVIVETPFWRAFLAPNQAYLGRSYVTLKRHCEDLAEVHPAEVSDFMALVKRLESALKAAFGATMFNWACFMNNAYQNTPPNPHVHWHLLPRYDHPVTFANETFTDPDFGHHYNRERKQDVSAAVKTRIVTALRDHLESFTEI